MTNEGRAHHGDVAWPPQNESDPFISKPRRALARLSWPTCTRTQWVCANARQGCRASSYEASTSTKPATDGRGSRRAACMPRATRERATEEARRMQAA